MPSQSGGSFSEVTALVEADPGQFKANIDPQWTIGGKPNGGYLLAMLGRATTAVGTHPHGQSKAGDPDRT